MTEATTQQKSQGRMQLVDHLGELRKRLFYALLAVVIAACVCFHFASDIFAYLMHPLEGIGQQKMVVLTPLEMFITYIKLAVLSGIFVAFPVVLWQLWQFIAPGLYPNERRLVVPFVTLGTLFFVGGAAFCFYLVLPMSFRYLVDMVPMHVEATYAVSAYYGLVTNLMLAFGLVFELPLVMTALGFTGIVRAQDFASIRKYWIVAAVVLGGILTPTPDPLTQMMMAVPLMVFFELGILGAQLCGRTRRAPKVP